MRAPLPGAEALIAHINDDHLEQLLYCVRAFTPMSAAQDARVTVLFTDGVEVAAVQDGRVERHFISLRAQAGSGLTGSGLTGSGQAGFGLAGLEPAFEATALEAMKRLGVWPPRHVGEWTLRENRALSPHFRRLSFALGTDTRGDWRPGDSCRFELSAGTLRPYTLRRVTGQVAEVDVFVHGDTPGSRWAQALAPGEAGTVRGERHEIFPDFTRGPALLLGDETALPTLAALLEEWAHPQPPLVLLELADSADRAYLDGVARPAGTRLEWFTRRGEPGAAQSETALRGAAEALPFTPAAVWGAGQVTAATALRHLLKRVYPLADVKVIGYWRHGSA